jgi:hypothetical protein
MEKRTNAMENVIFIRPVKKRDKTAMSFLLKINSADNGKQLTVPV